MTKRAESLCRFLTDSACARDDNFSAKNPVLNQRVLETVPIGSIT